jgi:hypothetical protein
MKLADLAGLSLTYPEVGATATAMPAGYAQVRMSRRIGTGQHAPSAPLAGAGIPATSSSSARGASGREIAEAFFNANPSNPLLPTQETS